MSQIREIEDRGAWSVVVHRVSRVGLKNKRLKNKRGERGWFRRPPLSETEAFPVFRCSACCPSLWPVLLLPATAEDQAGLDEHLCPFLGCNIFMKLKHQGARQEICFPKKGGFL